jgi:hypothetical protein
VEIAAKRVDRRLDAHVDARVGCSLIVTGGEGKGTSGALTLG